MLHTIGHGTLPADELVALFEAARIRLVVDVRAFPGSRRHPQFGREQMEGWLPAAGVAYRWMPTLGGRRRQVPASRHVALRNDSFRAYADHMETAEFLTGVAELLELAAGEPATVLCSESVWWRCHRRLLADHLTLLRHEAVVHLMHDGRRTSHALTAGARAGEGAVVYDLGVTPPLASS